jgi:hypothetical protein
MIVAISIVGGEEQEEEKMLLEWEWKQESKEKDSCNIEEEEEMSFNDTKQYLQLVIKLSDNSSNVYYQL